MYNELMKFIWIDLEMTSVNPEKGVILEFATIITDEQLNILEEFDVTTIGYDVEKLDFDFLPGTHEQMMEAFKSSGMLDRVSKSDITLKQAEEILLNQIKKHCDPKECYFAGNSVSTDARFIIKYMPKVWEYVNYRLLNITAIKLLKYAWYPEVPEFEKPELHDAKSDIKGSLAQLKYYRDKLFRQPK